MTKKKAGKGLLVPPTVLVETALIQEAPYNPNEMTPEEQDTLEASLRDHGLILNMVIQKHSEAYGPLVMIGGHWRLKTARRICKADGVPMPDKLEAKVLDVTDRIAARLNVALNGGHGQNDPVKLGELLARFQFDDGDLLLMSLSRDQEAALVALAAPIDEQAARLESEAAGLTEFARSVTLTVEFETVAQRDRVKAELIARAKHAKIKAGAVLEGALCPKLEA